ncbi:HdeD family acid-resistance protein [Candidatus Chloroploca sp. Khr17]|uniref:HdeD family acid-resistance protein n=1 Tax=Candidatus Chloroploca sp. Khr17 TaxID=2496869 RepID=UPI00101C8A40|nr:DUF308 domain-containing protein [Candidatus Chloroploca sp. Khr17]
MFKVPSVAKEEKVPFWLVLVLGISYIILGLLLLFQPLMTTLFIVLYIGASWLISGIADLISLFRSRERWFLTLLSGIIGIWAGLAVLSQPLLGGVVVATFYIIMLGVTGIFMGGVRVVQAFQGGGIGVGIWGVLTIVLSFLILSSPLAGVVVLPFVFGITALVGGIMTIVGAFIGRK